MKFSIFQTLRRFEMAVVIARKKGNSLYICLPAILRHKAGIKDGDVFELTKDMLLPDLYTLRKLGDNNI